jgi:hypothetical protein
MNDDDDDDGDDGDDDDDGDGGDDDDDDDDEDDADDDNNNNDDDNDNEEYKHDYAETFSALDERRGPRAADPGRVDRGRGRHTARAGEWRCRNWHACSSCWMKHWWW